MPFLAWSIHIYICGNRSRRVQVTLQLPNLLLQRIHTIVPQRHTKIIMTTNNSLHNGLGSFIRVPLDKVRNGCETPRSSDHLLYHSPLVGLAKAVLTPGRGADPGPEGRAERTRLHDENFDTEPLDLVGKGLVNRFDCKLAGAIRSASRESKEAVGIYITSDY